MLFYFENQKRKYTWKMNDLTLDPVALQWQNKTTVRNILRYPHHQNFFTPDLLTISKVKNGVSLRFRRSSE